MKYIVNPKAVIVKVCGETMIVATSDLQKTCPKSYLVNETAAFYLDCMKNNMSVDEMIAKAAEEYEVAADEIRQGVFDWLSDFEKKGYIIRSE